MVQELVNAFSVVPQGERFVATPPAWFGPRLFGGTLIGQAVAAAASTDVGDRRIHSLHAYFLRAGEAAQPISFEVTPIREGRSLVQARVEAWQDERHLLTMMCSFANDGEGYEYTLGRPALDDPPSDPPPAMWPGYALQLGPTEPEPDGSRRSTSRAWLRVASRLPDDPGLHAAILGFYSDLTYTGGRPLDLDSPVDGLISLDHSVWFHRPARADEWVLFDVHSLINTGGRGVLRGTMHTQDGTVVASMAQEMIIRPVA